MATNRRALPADHAALVRAHSDGPSALGADLDVEAELTAVLDLIEPGVRGTARALAGRGDVLDADLEPDGGLAGVEVRDHHPRCGVLHHQDHSRGGKDPGGEGAVDV